MAYIGNNLKVAYSNYERIDDISASFNGVTTSFTLLVRGAAPSVLPVNSQQCLISVGGAVQKPDDTGAEGFRLSGGNIIFSSAPVAGETFFGVILAGANYVNVGGSFVDGSVTTPSLTFTADTDTGIYRDGSGGIAFTSNGVKIGTLPSGPGTANQVLTTNGAGALSWTTPTAGVTTSANNAFTGANTFTNTTGQIFRQAATQDGVLLRGRAGGTSSFNVEIVPTTLSASQTLTLPNASGTVVLTGANNAFTGANTFYNATGQTFGTATTTNDGVIIAGRAGGTNSYRATLTPTLTGLTSNRTISIPNETGTLITNGGSNNINYAMLSGSGVAETTALTTDNANNLVWSYSGGALYCRLNTTNVGANVTTAQPVFNLGVTLASSTVYAFEAVYILTKTAGATTHVVQTLFGGTVTINDIVYTGLSTWNNVTLPSYANSGANNFISAISNSATTAINATPNVNTATAAVTIQLKGTVSVNTGGTFIPQYLLTVAPGGAYTVQPGSFIRFTSLGASGTTTPTTQGTWS